MPENFKEISRKNWLPVDGHEKTDATIKLGCLQRIANGVELMATDYRKLRESAEFYQGQASARFDEVQTLLRRNAALRGVITRLKKAPKPNPQPAGNLW